MNAELPPTFYLKGNAVFDWIEVFDLESPRSKSGDPRAIWRIEPDGPPPRLHSVPPITYGKVPSGFVQTDPYSEPPPALQEGHRYQLRVIIRSPDGNQLDEVFIIRNGKAERIEGGDEEHKNPCFAD